MPKSVFDEIPPDLQAQVPRIASKRSGHRETPLQCELSLQELREGRQGLKHLVNASLEVLGLILLEGDYKDALRAAQIILDRSGFGPKSTLEVNTTFTDLSELSRAELAERASAIAETLRAQAQKEVVH